MDRLNYGIGSHHRNVGIGFLFLLTFAVLAGGGLFATDAHAYSAYSGGCQNCHGAFTDGTSPRGTNFGAAGNKHEMHRSGSFMGTGCGLCHTVNGDTGSMTTSRGETGVAGRGCTGCHNGAGLRNHHRIAGASSCSCHGSSTEAAPAENVKPPYYGTSATRADNTCNPVATANLNENWSVGDFRGLDNDGDNLYDASDPNCAVAAVTLSSIAISGAASVNEGATATYTARATWSDGTTTAVTPTWSTNLGTISATGVLTAPSVTANQTATIGASYTSGGVTRTASATVTIVNVAATLSSIAIGGPASVNSGATGTFTATATWSDGSTTAVTPTWSTTLGTISAAGLFTAPSVTANQTATIGASYTSGGLTRTASVSVSIVYVPATLSSIAISGASSVNEGATSTYTATATWSDGTTQAVTPTWSTTLGTISAAGLFTAPSVTANQTATIGASYTSGGVTRTASTSVTIVNVAATLSSIAVSGPASVNSGATGTFTATATWSDGSTTVVTPTWSTTLGTISATGLFTAPSVTSNQTATIGASYTSGGATRTASASVSIVYVPATLSSIAISGASSVNEGATSTYTAAAAWSDGTTQTVAAAWSVSPTTNATINSTTGVLTAGTVTANQTVVVSASYVSGGVTRTASATVNIVNVAATLSSIAVSGASSVNEGATATYTATATWSDGSTTAVTPTWSTTLGTISAAGLFTAPSVTANQTATIGASYTSGGVTRTASATVTIVNAAATLSSIAVSGASSVNEGATGTFTATATWSDGSTTAVTPTWSTTLGTISAAGLFTAPSVTANQTAIIGASYTSGGVTRTASVTVTIVDVAATTGAVTTMPADGATGIPVNTVVTATVDSGDIRILFSRETFTLKSSIATVDSSVDLAGPLSDSVCVHDGVVQGSITYNDSHTRARFTPNCFLENNMTYIGEIASGGGSSSVPPQTFRFTTAAEHPDSDDDGADDVEDDHPNDSRRTSRWSSSGTGKIRIDAGSGSGATTSGTMAASSGPGIREAMAISDTTSRLNQDGRPAGYEFPDGLISFRAVGMATGTSATFKVTFPSGIAPGSKVYQVDMAGFHEVEGAVIAGDTVTMTVSNTDAQADVLVNPLGVATPAAAGSGSIDLASGSGGGGCSVAVRAGTGGSYIDGTLILAGLGLSVWGIRIRRRRR